MAYDFNGTEIETTATGFLENTEGAWCRVDNQPSTVLGR